jgi:hypothetical protein
MPRWAADTLSRFCKAVLGLMQPDLRVQPDQTGLVGRKAVDEDLV